MMTDAEVMERMNSAAVPGFKVTKVETIEDKRSIVDVYTDAVFEIKGTKKDIDTLENLFNQGEIIERKEKKGKIFERNLGERIKYFSRVENIINLELVNTSPNSFLILAGIDIKDVHIVKKGYKI